MNFSIIDSQKAKIKKPNAAKHCQTLPVPGAVIQLAEGHKGGVPTRGAGLGIPNLHPCSRDKVPEIVGKSSRSRNEHRHFLSISFLTHKISSFAIIISTASSKLHYDFISERKNMITYFSVTSWVSKQQYRLQFQHMSFIPSLLRQGWILSKNDIDRDHMGQIRTLALTLSK